MTTADALARIEAIETILARGASSTTVGDRRIDYDLEALRLERDRLHRLVSATAAPAFRRVVFNG
jgi:hypothetical protein